MLNIELDNTEAIEREHEKAKHRKRRINKRKNNHRINDLKYIDSNRHGLININTGKRMYKTKKNQSMQDSTNKRIRQNTLKIKSIMLTHNQIKDNNSLYTDAQDIRVELLSGLNNGNYKKIKTKNSFNGDKDIWKEPWLNYKPMNLYSIPKFNSKKDEKGKKPVERKVGA